MSPNPAAARQRLVPHLNGTAVLRVLRSRSALACRRCWRCKTTNSRWLGGGIGSGGDPQLDDLAQRHAGTDLFGREAIDFRVAAIAQDQPLLRVEDTDALRAGAEGRPDAVALVCNWAISARSSRSTPSNELAASLARVAKPFASGSFAASAAGFECNRTPSASAAMAGQFDREDLKTSRVLSFAG